jgi:alpha-mannosidase
MTRHVHMVGNAHIDPVWLWQWPEGYQEVRATFRSAIDRMEEFPEFVFTANSVLFLRWIEESDPPLFGAIRERIADGRWQVIGGWWLEPDCNLPGGEALVRHGLIAQRYLLDRFGITATVGANVDAFGHNATIPQLLRRSGMDSYVFLRPGPHEAPLPPLFWWEAADGSRVLAYRIPHEYNSLPGDLGYQVDKSLAQLPADAQETMVFYGVGNHGGGPTRANLESMRRLNANGGGPRLTPSHPRAFFDAILASGAADALPVHRGELQRHGVGCYSAHSEIKRLNRRTEQLLARAEKWSALADALGGPAYPRAELTQAWEQLLFNQFHDTLAGTSIAPAYEDARDQLGHAASLGATATNRALQAIAARIDLPLDPDTFPVVVFNPHPWPLHAVVELEFGGVPDGPVRVVDDAGAEAATQPTRSLATVGGWRGRHAFVADVPPLGYRTYRFTAGEPAAQGAVSAGDHRLANEHLAVEVDPRTGAITRLELLDEGLDLAPAAPGARAVVIDDPSDTWGHRTRSYDQRIGAFTTTSVRLVEHGAARAVLRVESRFESSTLVEELVLSAGARQLELRVTLDWRERLRMLKLRFATPLIDERATFDVGYGHVERPANGDEVPAQTWVDVSGRLPDGRAAGLSVLNDAKYGHDVRGGDVGVTVARSPVFAWHEPKVLDPDGLYEYLDQGIQRFTLRLLPHAGDWRAAGTVRAAAELNQPAIAALESFHAGPLPQQRSLASVASDTVVMAVLKLAEDDDALVVRAWETAGRAAQATFALPVIGRTFDADFGPGEIRTFRVPRDPDAAVEPCDLIERPEDDA